MKPAMGVVLAVQCLQSGVHRGDHIFSEGDGINRRKTAPPFHKGEPIESAPSYRGEFGNRRSGAHHRVFAQNAIHDLFALIPKVTNGNHAHDVIVSSPEAARHPTASRFGPSSCRPFR